MLKKFGIVAAGLLMSMTTLLADGQMKSNSNQQKPVDPNRLPGGGTVGFSLTTLAGAVAQIGYTNNCVTFDIGGNFFHNHDDNFGTVLGHLGFRSRIQDNFFFSMGAMGLGQFGEHSHKQWSAGVFTGLDYQFSKHFMIQGKVYPYNYDHRFLRARHNVFANSAIAFLYVF
ncbi:MAG: hypothetical protein KBA81_04460 [Rhabdochlamydiaceae bacterium]|nr:hypothetical protein [Rhabdochlamydiaceae bacterium]